MNIQGHHDDLAPPHVRPADTEQERWQRRTDEQHLKLLAIFYYVFAGLQSLGGCGGALYVVIGAVVGRTAPAQDPNAPPPEVLAGIFMAFGGCIMLLCLAWAGLSIATGLYLQRTKNRTFCMVVAGLNCLSIPLGTVLGIFTFLVLSRPGVIALFDVRAKQTAP